MQIMNDVSHAVAAAAGTAANPGAPPASGNSTMGMANEQTFLQLLVAQIQNQDPLSPTDSMQFVTQLAQFSSLEQLIGINQGVAALNADVKSNSTTPPATTPNPAGQ